MKKQLMGILICSVLLLSVPLAAGAFVDTEIDEQPTTGLLGWAWVRGWVLNPREMGNYFSARALRLKCIDFAGLETKRGIIKLKLISFKMGPFVQIDYLGPFSSIAYVRGFVHGGLDIQE